MPPQKVRPRHRKWAWAWAWLFSRQGCHFSYQLERRPLSRGVAASDNISENVASLPVCVCVCVACAFVLQSLPFSLLLTDEENLTSIGRTIGKLHQ